MSNLVKLKPSRKPLQTGDIFVLKIKQCGYIWGRVIRVRETLAGWPGSNMVYIYNIITKDLKEVPLLYKKDLLLGPVIINRLGWSHGYLQTITNVRLRKENILDIHCFIYCFLGTVKYFDENQNDLGKCIEPCGHYGLDSYRSLENKICRKLGIPLAPFEK